MFYLSFRALYEFSTFWLNFNFLFTLMILLQWFSYTFLMLFCSIGVVQDQAFSENDAFFAWTFVNRRPLWQTLLSFFWPVLTLAICLFPVYPHSVKLLILYSCAGLLLLILCLLFSKYLVLITLSFLIFPCYSASFLCVELYDAPWCGHTNTWKN